MSDWKYTDQTSTVAIRTLASGQIESCLASVLPEGTVIAPADIPVRDVQAEIDALEREIAALRQLL